MTRRHAVDDNHFRTFAVNVERAISRYGDTSEIDLTKMQKGQVEKLVGLERDFRYALIEHPWGVHVYKAFIAYICDERRNILAARPYFRERQDVFATQISKVLKKRQEKGLFKFNFSYEFVLFTMAQYKWRGRILQLSQEILQARTELIEMNLPLAISRARIFWSRTPRSHLSYMDLVQITAVGLMNAVDKFVLPYSPSFRSMAIGRMVGNLIEQYSETLVHFFPIDKRNIYRANKALSRQSGAAPDFEEIAKSVNEGVEAQHRTSAAKIADLLAASSTVSPDQLQATQEQQDVQESHYDNFRADESTHPDVRFEEAEAMSVLSKSIRELDPLDRKLLRLKGITL